ncbi:GLEYA adhesin domain protein [Cordyceps fumosorosea ARSEF 2679]|uniref:GLEYA adhesin domain protein n=1 Tax=Cordyceps fumosorosea (strain ARSEF 2679) TaxID=1081104 RepID=A0A167Q1L1_CORFA|nr:GLEYA adhesin domain protein [Cordyceps fumosorosea ARSEF 2679]OAA57202.1 GLEYA adhesin domain protein [Cordyceps fumosorosea ARSEF 2679]
MPTSVVTKVSSDGSVTLTLIKIITNNRTFTEEVTATTVETLPETSRETEVITTTVPRFVTFTTTSSGTPVVETSTSKLLTTETITTDVPILTTETELITDDNVDGSGFNPLFRNAAAGFLFACQAGRYRFNSPYANDITLLWFSDAAHSGYERADTDTVRVYYGDNEERDVYRDLEAGTYYLIRVLWENAGGALDLSMRIYGPDGGM